ncbi:TIM barrel protein [Candidatus Desulforudis audaxviator]|uniref:Xylose isomerase domain protein TIM barrel n=1 Tax=Desulforudis audaxviator (strain MP104C) TaxID=477974 RepID=B1I648_DESAP|nr:TIM barrel protein [Candidatus Desulforudis audaxviator]ACA60472.1 Xylose isomerase domain protein TIM barrel [Candidatus Desulforudis audaxviator MP104C]AZK60542.1 Endonuclease IV [Candidatus Desulforudis audaxviator]
MEARFGTAGNGESFYAAGHKSSLEAPAWLRGLGLSAYEYQCVRGVNISERTARALGERASENGIALSIHAPYYINLAGEDPVQVAKSKVHLLKSMRAAHWMGASRVVFHPGSVRGDRKGALRRAQAALEAALEEAAREGLDSVNVLPETLGRYSYLGLLDEVLELCRVAPTVIPCIDFGHVHAITGGLMTDREAYAAVLDRVGAALGKDVLRTLHIHFSPVEFTAKGERRHRTLADEGYGPNFGPLAELLVERGLTPTVICESNGTQSEDACTYRDIYREALRRQRM